MAGCLAVTLPLELVFGARVWRRPSRLVRSLLPPLGLFLVWDAVAIHRGTWWFSRRYTTGWRVPFAIPVEEVTFFLVVPVCGLLTYEAVKVVLARLRRG
jgi:lycopene cyclase domain-containing protein